MEAESELISRILEGDLDAFRLLVRQYEKLVAMMVGRVVQDPEEELDVRQKVFIRVYRKLHTFKHKSKLSTWMAKVAYNTAINHVNSIKGKKALIADLTEAENIFTDDPDPAESLIKKDTAVYIRLLVDRLPLPYRSVLTLYHINGLSYREITEITGMPEGAVKSHLFQARKLLKDKLKTYKR